MALVVFLRGVNVGGHKIFRPAILAKQLKRFDAVNIGAAGTFVIRQPVSQAMLREELERRLPFDTEIIMCRGTEILRFISQNPFAHQPARRDVVHFVSVLSHRPKVEPPLPVTFPPNEPWLLRILARRDRFVFGQYRRQMKAISYLGAVDRLFGSAATTRNWNTISAIAKVLNTKADRI